VLLDVPQMRFPDSMPLHLGNLVEHYDLPLHSFCICTIFR
jgi:hypothetical protein